MKRILFSAAILSFALAGAAQAQTVGTATTDLNVRSGPGPEQPVIGLIKSRHKAQIIGSHRRGGESGVRASRVIVARGRTL